MNLLEQIVQLIRGGIIVENDIRPSLLRLDKPGMHGEDCLFELIMNGSCGSPTFGRIALQASFQSDVGRTIDKNLKREKLAESGTPQKPQAIHKNQGFGMENFGCWEAAMGVEIVTGQAEAAARRAMGEGLLHQSPIDGPGMIKINPSSAAERQMRPVAVKIVEGNPACFLAQALA